MEQLTCWALGTLETLCQVRKIPSLVITNDWFTGLCAAYAKTGRFGNVFNSTTFVHIVHNLDASYEGRLYPKPNEGWFQHIHGLYNEKHFFMDPYWSKNVVNPSRCAIMLSDQWATVSPSYRNELLTLSPLKELLKQKSRPFAFPNGIPIQQRLARLADKGTHKQAKAVLQAKYFSMESPDYQQCLMSFVGRITDQKGVHLILEAAEQIIPESGFTTQFLVGGPANYKDPYSVQCANKMKDLRNRYPHNFFASPDEFFYDGPLVNIGSDFGLMPSKFEPGGIVQHEFFVAKTPVIAYKTGGLKDTVHEFNSATQEGSGFVFDIYDLYSFKQSILRAIELFKDDENYEILRENAFKATMDGATVCREWNKEFYRLRDKIYFEPEERKRVKDLLQGCSWRITNYTESLPKNRITRPEVKRSPSGTLLEFHSKLQMHENRSDSFKKHITFRYKTQDVKPKFVQLVGSFDKWQIRHPLIYDYSTDCWHTTLQLEFGNYFYKYVVDGQHWVVANNEPVARDESGFLNNTVNVN